MGKIDRAQYHFSLLDELAQGDSPIHRVHPLMIFLCTLIYIGFVTSFGRYEIVRLIPFVLYPAILFSASLIPVLPILKRALVVLPFVLGIGIVNLIVDRTMVNFGGVLISGGLLSLMSLFIRYGLTVTAALLMIATTGIVKLSYAMRMIKIPKLLVLQVSLTYRYISVLFEEVALTTLAYRLRSNGQKGIKVREWGSLTGQILLRTFDRAQAVYRAMRLRGFDGDYHAGGNVKLKYKDAVYFLVWVLIFASARIFDITQLLGSVISSLPS